MHTCSLSGDINTHRNEYIINIMNVDMIGKYIDVK